MKHVSKTAAMALALVLSLSAATIWYFFFHDRSLTRLQKKGTIRIGYAVEAPFAFFKPGGVLTGESPEVAKQIVARLGIPHIEWNQSEFGALISGLESGRFDLIAAGLFITPERAKRVTFSEPTFHVRQGLLVLKNNPHHLNSYQQAAALPKIKIAVIFGAVEEMLLRRIGLPDSRLVLVPDALAGRTAVESNLADGLALSSPTIQWMASRDQLGKTEMAAPFEQPESALISRLGYGAFAFRKEDRELQSAWNSELKTFIGSPEHLKLIAEFGFTAEDLPGTVTTSEVLSQL
ncbi:MAG: ectoine/hydroxyectoine ABC transporter substrate-binding protein EhuB [Deltaproteobacteria bacterium]|nr:ectoine/hydroxyectoine ABC transporter substrate-binding protein EhuB [Deltaproteobacteria bacterium]